MAEQNVVEGKIKSFLFDKLETISQEEKGYHKDKPKKRKIKGFANKSTVDRGAERVDPQAFEGTMEKFMQNPVVFYNHDWTTPVGKVVSFDISESGLEVEVDVAEGYEEADKVWSYIEQDLVKSFSIGFVPKKLQYEPKEDFITIKELELLEVSIVTIPMNAESLFTVDSQKGLSGIEVNYEGKQMSYKNMIERTEHSTSDNDENLEVSTKHVAEVSTEDGMTVIKFHNDKSPSDDADSDESKLIDEDVETKATGLPDYMKSALRKGLRLHEEGRSGGGLKSGTVRDARQGLSGGWSDDKIIRASAWFARHASDKKPGWDTPGKETPGYVAWLLWGDSGSGTGRAWVDRKAEAIKNGKESSGKKELPDNSVRQLSLDFVDGSCTSCSVDNVKVLSVAIHPSGRENFECLACFIEKTPWEQEYSEDLKRFGQALQSLREDNDKLEKALMEYKSSSKKRSDKLATEIIKITSHIVKDKL